MMPHGEKEEKRWGGEDRVGMDKGREREREQLAREQVGIERRLATLHCLGNDINILLL